MQNNKVDDFTYELIWMSMRFWLSRDENMYSFIRDYPTQMVSRFWAKLDDLQRSKLISDAQREIEYAFDDGQKKRAEYMLCVLNGKTKATLEEYIANLDVDDDFNTILCQAFYVYKNVEMDYNILDEFDFIMLRMAILYACPRMTIASATLPEDIIKYRYKLFSFIHISQILLDLNNYLNWVEENFKCGRRFSESFDDKIWKKFLAFLDETTHFDILGNDDKTYKTFLCDEVYYSYDRYITNPYIDCYISPENIVKITKNNDLYHIPA